MKDEAKKEVENKQEATMKEEDQKIAIFWCSLLRPLLYGEYEKCDFYSYLCKLSTEEVRFPNGVSKKPTLSTLKRKLKQYQTCGFESLARRSRSDRGLPRKVSVSVIAEAVAIKSEQAKRSASTINLFLKKSHGAYIPKSTLHRHLRLHNATQLKLGVTKTKVRCRWTRDNPNELWIGDFSDGPYVIDANGMARQSHLSLFIDCHSRFVVEGRYYFRESLDILIDSLLRAWTVNGVCDNLYLDNAKVYHANALKAACFSLNVKLLHRAPGDPPPGGLVERIFGTNQTQFETEVRAGDMLSLDYLNRAFQAWLHNYHNTIHSEIKCTPNERYQKVNKRLIDMHTAVKFFMQQKQRVVHSEFSDVSINNRFYSVDPKFRRDKVLVRYDPFGEMNEVLIFSLNECFLCTAHEYKRELTEQSIKNERFNKHTQHKPKFNYIDLIVENHEEHINKQVSKIDFAKLVTTKRWSFVSMVQTLANLLGKTGGISAFLTNEVEELRKIYNRYPNIDYCLLHSAFEAAEVKNIAHITLQLQLLKNR